MRRDSGIGLAAAAGARELAAAIVGGQTTSRRVVEEHLARIDARNPTLNAVVDARSRRRPRGRGRADRAIAEGGPRGPLHGVPVTIKDTCATAGLRTTAARDGWPGTCPRAMRPLSFGCVRPVR